MSQPSVVDASPASDTERAARPRSPSQRTKRFQSLLRTAERYVLLILLVSVCLLFAVLPATSSNFWTVANFRNVASQQAVVAVLALGVMVPLVALQFDLSIAGVLTLSSVVVAKLTADSHWPVLAALGICLALGLGVGLVNGVLVAKVRASSLIVTLGVSTLVGGVVTAYTGGQTVVNVPSSLVAFGNGLWLGLPRLAWVMAATAALVGYALHFTVFGRQLAQIGSNPVGATMVGIRVGRRIIGAFLLSGVLAAVAGILLTTSTGTGNPSPGLDTGLSALAAAFLGSTVVRPGHFNVIGTLIGVFFAAVTVNGLELAGVSSWIDPVVNGSALVVAISIATVISRKRGRRGSAI